VPAAGVVVENQVARVLARARRLEKVGGRLDRRNPFQRRRAISRRSFARGQAEGADDGAEAVLVGMPGSGKVTIGTQAGPGARRSTADNDAQIVETTGSTITRSSSRAKRGVSVRTKWEVVRAAEGGETQECSVARAVVGRHFTEAATPLPGNRVYLESVTAEGDPAQYGGYGPPAADSG